MSSHEEERPKTPDENSLPLKRTQLASPFSTASPFTRVEPKQMRYGPSALSSKRTSQKKQNVETVECDPNLEETKIEASFCSVPNSTFVEEESSVDSDGTIREDFTTNEPTLADELKVLEIEPESSVLPKCSTNPPSPISSSNEDQICTDEGTPKATFSKIVDGKSTVSAARKKRIMDFDDPAEKTVPEYFDDEEEHDTFHYSPKFVFQSPVPPPKQQFDESLVEFMVLEKEAEFSSKLSELSSNLERLGAENKVLADSLATKELEVELLLRQVDETQRNYKLIRKDLTARDGTIKDLEARIDQCSIEVESKESEIITLRSELNTKTEKYQYASTERDQEIDDLKRALFDAKAFQVEQQSAFDNAKSKELELEKSFSLTVIEMEVVHNEQMKAISAQIVEKESELMQLRSEVEGLISEIERKNSELNSASVGVVQMSNEFATAQLTIQQLQSQLKALEDENLNDAAEQLQCKNFEIEDLRAEVAVVAAKLEANQKEQIQISNQMAERESELVQLQSERERLLSEVERKDAELNSVSVGIAEMANELATAQLTIEQLRSEVKALEDIHANKVAEQLQCKNLEIENICLESALNATKLENAYKEQIRAISTQMEEKETEFMQLRSELGRVSSEVERKNTELSSVVVGVAEISNELAAAQVTIQQLRSELKTLEDEHNNEVTKQLQCKSFEIEDLRAEVAVVAAKLEANQKEQIQISNQMAERESELVQLQSERERLLSEVERKDAELNSVSVGIAEMANELATAQLTIEQLRSELKALEDEHTNEIAEQLQCKNTEIINIHTEATLNATKLENAYKEELEKISYQMAEKESELVQLRSEISQLVSKVSTKNAELQLLNTGTIETLETAMVDTKKDVESIRNLLERKFFVETPTEDHTKCRREVEELKTQLATKEIVLEEIQTKLKKEISERERLEKLCDNFDDIEQDLNSQLFDASKKLRLLQEEKNGKPANLLDVLKEGTNPLSPEGSFTKDDTEIGRTIKELDVTVNSQNGSVKEGGKKSGGNGHNKTFNSPSGSHANESRCAQQ